MSKVVIKKPVHVIELSKPIEHGDEKIEKLEFVEIQARHLRSLKGEPDMGDFLDIAGAATGMPKTVMDKLCVKDTLKVIEYMGNVLDDGQETGESKFPL